MVLYQKPSLFSNSFLLTFDIPKKYLHLKKFNNLPILILITINLLVFGGCEKHSDPKNVYKYYYLTPSQVAQSPYFTSNKYDTLSFFNTLGDTFTFAKIKTDTAFIKESSTEMGSEVTTYYNYQYLHNTYQTLKGNGKFEVWHKTTSVSNSIYINLNRVEFGYSSDRVGKKFPNWPFFEEYKLGEQSFRNVTLLNPLPNNSINVYINVEDGLLSLIDNKTIDTLSIIKK